MRPHLPSSGSIVAAVYDRRAKVGATANGGGEQNAFGARVPPRGKGEGFTLIEVLVALAIFALSGLMLASSYVNVLAAHQAALHREDLAPELRLVREALYTQPDRDKVEAWNELTLPDDRQARWRGTLTATPVADLFDVTLEIEFTSKSDGNKTTVTENCRLLRPTWSQSGDRETLRANARSKLAQRTFQ